jgi:hypothetical protein
MKDQPQEVIEKRVVESRTRETQAMPNENCQAVGCKKTAAALVTQVTRESAGQPSKTINSYMCAKHAQKIQETNATATVTWL